MFVNLYEITLLNLLKLYSYYFFRLRPPAYFMGKIKQKP